MDVMSGSDLATAILPVALKVLLESESIQFKKKGTTKMKKMLVALGLMALSMSVLADDSSIQMVLDSVHKAGFTGCDKEIREHVGGHENIYHVETKIPFKTGSGKNSVAVGDEVIVIYGVPGNAQYDWEEGVRSFMVRKIGKECAIASAFQVSASVQRNCQTIAKVQDSYYAVVTKSDDGSYWTRHGDSDAGWDAQFKQDGTKLIYTPLSSGACRYIGLPDNYASWTKMH